MGFGSFDGLRTHLQPGIVGNGGKPERLAGGIDHSPRTAARVGGLKDPIRTVSSQPIGIGSGLFSTPGLGAARQGGGGPTG